MPASLFVFMGLIASGKSTLAGGLAKQFSLPYFNTDVVRKELAGKAPESRQGSPLNQGIYTPEFTRMTYDALLDHARRELSCNQSVVLDGSYHKQSERQRVVQCAAECGAALFFILCQCDDKETERRLAMRARNPQAVSDGTWEIFKRQKEGFEFPDELPGHSLMVFDTKGSAPQLLQKLVSVLSESHAV
ncbi:MAG: AAA family ATPase [Proteobacteria bacterium]|nr:AAA family ATPase [Pseudomonadota bacterium]MBU0967516.1 AAA family ATPase [Pseudomonadota bacterium]